MFKKKKISFSRKLMQSALNEAYSALNNLKLFHDDIEALYNPYVNFDAIYESAENRCEWPDTGPHR